MAVQNRSYPKTVFELYDYTSIPTIPVDYVYDDTPVLMMTFTADKGPEEWRTLKSFKEFNETYGGISFDKHGQSHLIVAEFLRSGGYVLCKRLVSNNATLANVTVHARVVVVDDINYVYIYATSEANCYTRKDAEDAGYGKYMTNNSDEEVSFSFYASELGYDLPYGVVASAAKATGQELFVQWVKSVYGNDPYEGFGKYWGMLTATVPAKFAVSKISVTPIKVSKTVVFPLEDGDFEQAVDMVETYIVKVDGTSLAHDHGHGHGTETNAGGGSGE